MDATPSLPPTRTARGSARLEATTLWDFPAQPLGDVAAGNPRFNGCTPALVLWNLLRRYTKPGDLVVDCMAGSGTTIDVARITGRRVLAFDLHPTRPDIVQNDARSLPLQDGSVDLHFVDSPYSDNVRYSDDPACLGRLSAQAPEFYEELGKVARELRRTLRPGGILAWVISDEYRHGTFTPVGVRLYRVLEDLFEPVDVVCLVRRHDRSLNPLWEHRARKYGFFLRGFKYLYILRKSPEARG